MSPSGRTGGLPSQASNTCVKSQTNNPKPRAISAFEPKSDNTPRREYHLDFLAGFVENTKVKLGFLKENLKLLFPNFPFKESLKSFTLRGSGHTFEYCFENLLGVSLRWYFPENKNSEYQVISYLVLPGKAFEVLSVPDSLYTLGFLAYDFNFRCTRLDVAFDDYSRAINPEKLYSYCLRGNYSGARRFSDSGSLGSDGHYYKTVYLGKKDSSDKVLRVYDARPLHDIDAIRWEIQLRRGYAQIIFEQLLPLLEPSHNGKMQGFYNPENFYDSLWSFDCESPAVEANICNFFSNLILGSFDFFEGKKDKNLDRNKRARWWAAFLKASDVHSRFRFSVRIPKTSLDKSVSWLFRQVSKFMGLLSSVVPEDIFQFFFFHLQDIGINKLESSNDWHLLETLQSFTRLELRQLLQLSPFVPS